MTTLTSKAVLNDTAFLLKKTHLFKKADFTRLFAAQKKPGRLFVLYYQEGNQGKEPLFGLVVSKKYAGTAVRRNLIKRVVREHFRLNQHEVAALQMMFVAKKGVDVASKEALHQDLGQLFSFLKKINYSKNEKVSS